MEQSSAAIAERVARELVEQANATAAAEREAAALVADDKLQATLLTAHSNAENVARQTLDAARTSMEEASRGVLESARADLSESVRAVAEVASKPAAEAAARAVAEEVMRDALVVAREEEAVSRQRVEENAIIVAERVGRELVKMVFSATQLQRSGAEGDEGSGAHGVAGLAGSADASKAPVPQVAPAPAGWAKGAVPWLAGLTLAVLYLLYRTFV